MENKYSTPSIEDIRVGYECEWTSDGLVFDTPYSEPLYKGKLEYADILDILKWYDMDGFDLTKVVRVPYLTKEQIEAEGWKHCFDLDIKLESTILGSSEYKSHLFLLRNYYSALYTGTKLVIFNDSKEGRNPKDYLILDRKELDIFYNGECKSIDEFRYICKLLGI